jgi:hypothetical protein
MHYEIRRGHKTNKPLTQTQRSSGTFSEEPIVLGKVMRRGSSPLRLTAEQFEQQKSKLLRQLLAGSIELFVVDQNKTPARLDYKTARGFTPSEPVIAGDNTPPPVLSPALKTKEEQEAELSPPSSPEVGDPPPDETSELAPELDLEPAPVAPPPSTRRSKKEQT